MRVFVILAICGLTVAEPPRHIRPFLSRQQLPHPEYLPPSEYGPPPSTDYGPPPTNEYGPPKPSHEYGPPIPPQIVTKNIYVHLPPRDLENEEPAAPPPNVEKRTPQKHYKIVFIKTPNQQPQKAPEIPEHPQDEHKTLVYVLVKKQEPPKASILPPPTTTEASRPEVYFIKYKENKPSDSYGPPR